MYQGCILSPCLVNLYAEYIMRNAELDKSQAGIKITGRSINNLRYADDTTLMAESGELKNLFLKVKEERKKFTQDITFRKLRSWHSVPSVYGNRCGNNGNSDRFYFGGSKITADSDFSHEIKKCLLLGRKAWST